MNRNVKAYDVYCSSYLLYNNTSFVPSDDDPAPARRTVLPCLELRRNSSPVPANRLRYQR